MNRRGFTLVELLVALAIVGFLLVAMNTFLFSMGELWGRQSEQRLFELHVRNVTRFLQGEFRRASLPPANATDFTVREMRTRAGLSEELLSFVVPDGGRLCEWPEGRALPNVLGAYALRERRGLFFLWHSTLEEKFEDQPPRETLVSPWVTRMDYDYYDSDLKLWKTERMLRKPEGDKRVVPGRIRLTFEYAGMKREVALALPLAVEGLPQL
ncbi:PilW family protein [Nibricoccus sp. IMCC34717]|uniref:PilW family protein n=1 Tax=Nibricoccus sp. IMCC34717 TaxID=3034021 RepID=UPI00384A99F2